jgi:hypothetical protein
VFSGQGYAASVNQLATFFSLSPIFEGNFQKNIFENGEIQ